MMIADTSDETARLNRLSVKELRRQAAVKNVPLLQISAAVEKADLINLIVKAGPVLDTYDQHLGVKVHSATSIAEATQGKTQKKKKPKKKRRRRSSSSSASSRSSKARGRRQKRSKSRRRSPGHKKRSRSRKRSKSRSSSPSLTIIVPPAAVKPAAPAPAASGLRALPAPGANSGVEALPSPDAALPPPPAPAKSADQPTIAQKGMAAAAALGFDVLPKAPGNKPAAPAEGLRPTINSAAPAPYGASMLPGGRICIQYLCTSKCDLGGNCPEAHIIDPEEEMRVRARFKEQECHYGAQCSRPGCLFRHPGERLEEGQFVPEGQQVALRSTPQGMQVEFM